MHRCMKVAGYAFRLRLLSYRGLGPANPPYGPRSVELQLQRFNHRGPECNVGGKRLAECFGI